MLVCVADDGGAIPPIGISPANALLEKAQARTTTNTKRFIGIPSHQIDARISASGRNRTPSRIPLQESEERAYYPAANSLALALKGVNSHEDSLTKT
jgi:hypothetical protein